MFSYLLYLTRSSENLTIDGMDVQCIILEDEIHIGNDEVHKPAIVSDLYFEFTIPETINYKEKECPITAIEAYSFYKTNITKIVIPKTIKFINSTCFENCKHLQTIIVDKENPNFTVIDDALYSKNKTILYKFPYEGDSFDILSETRIYSDSCFTWCTFTGFTVPKKILSLGTSLFSYNEDLKRIDLRNTNLKYIPNRMFIGCKRLEIVDLPKDITAIGSQTFQGTAIKSFKFPKTLNFIGKGAFKNSRIEEVELLETQVINITDKSFAMCNSLKLFRFPDKLENVETNSFNGTKNIEFIVYRGSNYMNQSVFECFPYAYITYKYPGKWFLGLITDNLKEEITYEKRKVSYSGRRF